MDIYGAKFQEHCFNNFREIVYSVFTTFQLHVVWHHHLSNLHNRKTSISLKCKKVFQKEKHHSSVFWKAFQISRKKFLCHIHFKNLDVGNLTFPREELIIIIVIIVMIIIIIIAIPIPIAIVIAIVLVTVIITMSLPLSSIVRKSQHMYSFTNMTTQSEQLI